MKPLLDSEKLPVIDVPRSTLEIVLELFSVIVITAMILNVVFSYSILPDRFPQHFGAAGKPDAWGGKETLFFLPIITIFLYGMMTLISQYPHIYNYPWKLTEENIAAQYLNARTMIAWLKTGIVCVFSYLSWRSIQVALGKASGLGIGFLPIFLVIIFGILGFFIYKGSKIK